MIRFVDLSMRIAEATQLYNYYICKSTATFHTEEISLNSFKNMVIQTDDFYESYAILDEEVFTGYMYFFPFSPRQAYRRTAEVSIYMKSEYLGRGIAAKALDFLEKKAKSKGVKNIIAKITEENNISTKFFEKQGYVICGILKEVGEKFERLHSVIIYQKMI